jgi:RND family efflux transporter MFP subunit
MRWKVPAVIVLLAVGVGAVAYAVTGGLGGARASGPQYLTSQVSSGDIADTVVATGSLVRATTYDLDFGVAPSVVVGSSSSSASGGSGTWSVSTVKVAVGDLVKKGDVLATADTAILRRSLSSAQANLAAAKTQKTVARTNLDNASGTDAIRQARIGYDQASSQYTQQVGQVADLQLQIARATIVAPVDGTVVTVNAVAGADLSSGPAVALSSGSLEVTADFTETDLPSLKLGQPASVTVDAVNTTIAGKVTAIAPSAAASSGSVVTYSVTIELTTPPAAARPGMSANASVTIASATGVLTIPAIALSGSAINGYTVLVLGQDGTAQTRDVTVGLVTSTQAEVQSGLQAGEAVVTGTTAAQTTTTTTGGGFGLPGGGFQRGTGGNGGNNGGNNRNGGGTQP